MDIWPAIDDGIRTAEVAEADYERATAAAGIPARTATATLRQAVDLVAGGRTDHTCPYALAAEQLGLTSP